MADTPDFDAMAHGLRLDVLIENGVASERRIAAALRAAFAAGEASMRERATEQCWLEAAGDDNDGARRAGNCARRIRALLASRPTPPLAEGKVEG